MHRGTPPSVGFFTRHSLCKAHGERCYCNPQEAFVANQRREAALYRRYHSFYGYAFYIGRKRVDTDGW